MQDRLLSEFRFRVARDEIDERYDANGLSAWLRQIRALSATKGRAFMDCHLIPQVEFMLTDDGDELCRHVLDFDHLERDFEALMASPSFQLPISIRGVRANKSPHAGATKRRPGEAPITLSELDAAERAWVEEVYRRDLEVYGALVRRGEEGGGIAGAAALAGCAASDRGGE